jgi:ribosome-associated protein
MKKTQNFTLREGEEFIPLVQLLKATQVASSGGEAQAMIVNETVRLNGQIELRKRAKIRPGDRVSYGNVDIVVNFPVSNLTMP